MGRRTTLMLNSVAAASVAVGLSVAPRAASAARAHAGWTGTITMYAQAYTPNSKVPNTNHLTAFQQVADAYQSSHPGVKIQFIDIPFPANYEQFVRVKAAAGQMWDVFWAQWASLNGDVIPPGVATDLTPYFNQKNPYVANASTWQAAMNPTVLAYTQAPGGKHYNIDGDFVGTAFYYNKALFKQAGIASPPSSWQSLLGDCAKIKAAGLTCVTGAPNYSWFQRHFLSDFYHNDFTKIARLGGSESAIGSLAQAVAIKKGILTPKDPRFMSWWPTFKAFTAYWDPQYLNQDPGVVGPATEQAFASGQAAIFYSGSWEPTNIKRLNPKLDLGSFTFPVLGKSVSSYSTRFPTAAQVGGPNAAFQFAMSSPKADTTLANPAKRAAVLDWLRYVGTPRVIEKVVNELGSFVPTWAGTKPAASNTAIKAEANQKIQAVGVGDTSPELGTALQKTFGSYLAGNISLQQASAQVQQELDASAAAYAKANKIDLSKY